MMTALLSPFLTACLAVTPLIPATQENRNDLTPNHSAYQGLAGIVDEKLLGVDLFTPQFINPVQLAQIAGEVAGADLRVRSADASIAVRNRFNPVAASIAIVDDDASRDRLLQLLVELDRQIGAEEAALREQAALERPATTTFTPRHVSINTAFEALGGAQIGAQGFGVVATPLYEVGSLLLRGSGAEVAAALDLMAAIDQPRAQVLLTVYAIGATEGDSSPDLPADLAAGLSSLVPNTSFELLGSAAVRSTVAGKRVKLEGRLVGGESLQFVADPSAFDESTEELFLNDCSLAVRSASTSQVPRGQQRDIDVTTSVSIRVGEYVVMAAAGSSKTYFVVHAQQG